jgi:S1-C subfamily serine protease
MIAIVQFGLVCRNTRAGAAIQGVLPESAAAEAGFETGQIVTMIGGKAVNNWNEVAVAASDAGLLLGRRVPFTVVLSGEEQSEAPKAIEVQIPR